MKKGGTIGFHCEYQYPQTFEDTWYDEGYPLMLEGTDAALFTIFRVFILTVHIKAYKNDSDRSDNNSIKRNQGLLLTRIVTATGAT